MKLLWTQLVISHPYSDRNSLHQTSTEPASMHIADYHRICRLKSPEGRRQLLREGIQHYLQPGSFTRGKRPRRKCAGRKEWASQLAPQTTGAGAVSNQLTAQARIPVRIGDPTRMCSSHSAGTVSYRSRSGLPERPTGRHYHLEA